jgi:hypothetical protein
MLWRRAATAVGCCTCAPKQRQLPQQARSTELVALQNPNCGALVSAQLDPAQLMSGWCCPSCASRWSLVKSKAAQHECAAVADGPQVWSLVLFMRVWVFCVRFEVQH